MVHGVIDIRKCAMASCCCTAYADAGAVLIRGKIMCVQPVEVR